MLNKNDIAAIKTPVNAGKNILSINLLNSFISLLL